MQDDNIRRLPADQCRFHTTGRCLYEAALNPGYDTSLFCVVLTGWEKQFDDFLARAESFKLDKDDVPGLWQRRFERLVRERLDCELYSFSEELEPPACRHLRDRLCHFRLPECEGRCRHYEEERQN